MPRNLRDAIDLLALDSTLKSSMGKKMHTQYIHLKETEIEYFAEMTDEELF